MFRTQNFEKLLDKATSSFQLEPDWPTIIQICDLIRQGDYPPKLALNSIKKKIQNPNPHVAFFALLVLESTVKNCGHLMHDEIATKAFMDQLRDLVKTTPHEKVRTKILELVQAWATAFRTNPKYHLVQETMTILKAEGYKFSPFKESDAMFAADTAPEWVDADVCHRCRASFGVVNRKHHCRACGNVFCALCSSKNSTLPKFGIEKEVRVCEACYDIHNKPHSATQHKAESESSAAEFLSASLAQQSHNARPKKTDEELKEEEDIQLALALSQSEAEAKEKEKKRLTSEIISSAATIKKISIKEEEEDDDPELARYLNRSFWEKRQTEEKLIEKKRSSPDRFRSSPGGPPSAPTTPTHHLENGEMQESELNEFLLYLKSQVEIFVNRMKSNSSRGRSISNDSSVQTLFMNVTMNHSTLLRYIHQQDDARVYYEGLQDKLAQVKDAMMALDALREEHKEKLRREAEEAERQKQLQMAHKLEIMRRRKQEYLQYQRQIAIQKMQEQEREMQMRQEQQKQQYLIGSLGYSTWDSKMTPMQPPHQYGPQYQSLPPGNPPPTGYAIPTSNVSQQPPPQMTGLVPPNVIPPTALASSCPQSLPVQHSSRVAVQPQPGPQRMVQPNQVGPLPNPGMPQMPSHIPPNFPGVPVPGQNPPTGPSSMISHPQPLVMPPNGPVNVLLPSGTQPKVTPSMTLPRGSPGGPLPAVAPNIPQSGSQPRLPQGPSPNSSLPPQNMTMQQIVPPNIPLSGGPPNVPQIVSQNSQQQFPQVRPGEQNHSSSTGELISFD